MHAEGCAARDGITFERLPGAKPCGFIVHGEGPADHRAPGPAPTPRARTGAARTCYGATASRRVR
jgi:hypothetical protein